VATIRIKTTSAGDGLLPQLAEAFSEAPKWWRISMFDVRRQYLFTTLGPLWLVVSNIVFVGAVAYLYSSAFGLDLARYFPYFAIGYIVWTLLLDSMGRGANIFVTEYAQISQIRMNLFGVVLKSFFARMLVFFLNMAVLLIALPFIAGSVRFTWQLPVGLLLLSANLYLQSYWTSALAARFRDIPLILSNIMRVAFFLTPIIWQPARIHDALRLAFVGFNPFYYLIDVVRAPLLTGSIPVSVLAGIGVISLVNLLLLVAVFRVLHRRIVYEAA
jgi:lipopolysaccharide transport system permease protein